MNIYRIGCLIALLLVCGSAHALQEITGKVKYVEATYMPTQIYFALSEGNAACPAGKTLIWAGPTPDNTKAVYTSLLTALTSGKSVRFIFPDNDTSCVGQFIYIMG